jgi:hypothetical protein
VLQKIENAYWSRPILWDLVISAILIILLHISRIWYPDLLKVDPKIGEPIIGDLAAVALTMAGFIITILTLLISFKNGFDTLKIQLRLDNKDYDDDPPRIVKFFNSGLYTLSANYLRLSVVELVLLSILLFAFRLFADTENFQYYASLNIVCLTIIPTSLYKAAFIFKRIIEMQKVNLDD